MQMKPWALRQPGSNLGMFVGGVVIEHQMHIQIGGALRLDMPQET